MNSTTQHISEIEESLIEKMTQQAIVSTDPQIKRELLKAATQLVEKAISRFEVNC